MPTPTNQSLRTLEQVLPVEPAIVRGLALAVQDAMRDGPLTLAVRDRLIGRSHRLGVGRFEANLIVAAVERRHAKSHKFSPAARPARSSRFLRLLPAVTAICVQATIVAGAWWLLI